MDDRYVLMLEEYIRDNLPVPDRSDEDYIFELHTYSRWAAYEVLNRMIRETTKLPSHISGREPLSAEEIVEQFIDEMDYYAMMSPDLDAKDIFFIASSEGRCILMYICSCK